METTDKSEKKERQIGWRRHSAPTRYARFPRYMYLVTLSFCINFDLMKDVDEMRFEIHGEKHVRHARIKGTSVVKY